MSLCSLVFELRSLHCLLTPMLTLNDFMFFSFIEIPLIFIQECVFLLNFAFSSATNEDKSRRTVRLIKSEITLNSFDK